MKIICIGRNYVAHAKELNNTLPDAPVIFMKPQTALLQKGKDFYLPDFSKDIQYECELVVKICKNGKYIQEKFAKNYFEEITVGLDFTARDLQQQQKEKGLPWEIAKAFDNSAVVGNFIPLAAKDFQQLHFQLFKNEAVVQNGFSGDMLFSIHQIIAYVSQFFSLNKGDLIFTGTPAGVGSLHVGDTLCGKLEGQPLFEIAIK
ncbi:MAG TPA: fumarylacetoacetate hydrolase family protein [Flavipsychrobacter sp.]|nr:fumarylacetoacetate hydrolase family protein [Flavipsychrobacter sp.]